MNRKPRSSAITHLSSTYMKMSLIFTPESSTYLGCWAHMGSSGRSMNPADGEIESGVAWDSSLPRLSGSASPGNIICPDNPGYNLPGLLASWPALGACILLRAHCGLPQVLRKHDRGRGCKYSTSGISMQRKTSPNLTDGQDTDSGNKVWEVLLGHFEVLRALQHMLW